MGHHQVDHYIQRGLILSGLLSIEVYTQVASPDSFGSSWGPQNLYGFSQAPYFLLWQEPKAASCLYGQLR